MNSPFSALGPALILALLVTGPGLRCQPVDPGILPIPQEAVAIPGRFDVDASVTIALPLEPTEHDRFLARSLAGEVAERHGLALSTERLMALPSHPVIVLGTEANPLVREAEVRFPELTQGSRPGPEGYRLLVCPQAVVVVGSDEAGAFYGLQSLRQLLAGNGPSLQLAGVSIRDWPLKPIRGVKLYLPGRDQFGFFRRFVGDFMALYKLNYLLVEFNGAMRYERHPEINAGWIDLYKDMNYTRRMFPKGPGGQEVDSPNQDVAEGGVLEPDEVAELVAEARRQHIQFVPEVPSLSHSYYLLSRHRELADPMEKDWEWPDAYAEENPASHRLLFDVLNEIIAVTHPGMVHIGHDEWQVPLGTAPGTTSEDRRRQYADDVRTLHDFLGAKGIRTAMYGDFLIEQLRGRGHFSHPASASNVAYEWPGALPPEQVSAGIPKDILIYNWFWKDGVRGKGEANDLELSRFGFQQVYSSNYSPDMDHYDRRSVLPGVVGVVPASWTTTNEANFSKDRLVDFIGWGNLTWSAHWPSLAELVVRVQADIPGIRQRLSGQSLPSEEGDAVRPIPLPAHPVGALDPAWKVPPEAQTGIVVGVAGKTGSTLPQVSPAIPIDADVSSLIFLQTLAREAANEYGYDSLYSYPDSAELMGYYEIVYADGLVTTAPIRYGANILEWSWGRPGMPDAFPLPAHVSYGAPLVRLPGGAFFSFEWTNPRLGRVIKEVRLHGSAGFRTVARNSHGMESNAIILRAVSAVGPRPFPGPVRAQTAPR